MLSIASNLLMQNPTHYIEIKSSFVLKPLSASSGWFLKDVPASMPRLSEVSQTLFGCDKRCGAAPCKYKLILVFEVIRKYRDKV